MDRRYFETVQLLLDVAPLIFRGGDFAMKGGTAINLFHRDMPRLSVDIDVVYIHGNRVREEALATLVRIATILETTPDTLLGFGDGDAGTMHILKDRIAAAGNAMSDSDLELVAIAVESIARHRSR